MNIAPHRKEKLNLYKDLLKQWGQKINLVSKKSILELEKRHFQDSLQLIHYIPDSTKTLIDLGSGAGFPGMVIAIATNIKVTLVESDERKAQFLQNVSRETKTDVEIIVDRIEKLKPKKFDVITARALAPLGVLCFYAFPFCGENSLLLFLKGNQHEAEIKKMRKYWDCDLEISPSKVHSDGRILKIKKLINKVSK